MKVNRALIWSGIYGTIFNLGFDVVFGKSGDLTVAWEAGLILGLVTVFLLTQNPTVRGG